NGRCSISKAIIISIVLLRDALPIFNKPIAVVIYTIAGFGCSGINSSVGIIAIGIVGYIAYWCGAGLNGRCSISKAIIIAIGIEASKNTFINSSIAVVIYTIAGFSCSGIDSSVAIIAIGVVGYIACWCGAGLNGRCSISKAIIIAIGIE